MGSGGVVAACTDFRMGGQYPYPSSLQDINYATCGPKVPAADFKADAATVGGIGVFSGGHLIMLGAMGLRLAIPTGQEA